MAFELEWGQIWMSAFNPPDKKRPVLVLSRPELLRQRLHQVTVAAITSTLRGHPSEVEVGVEEGLKVASAVNLINVNTVPRTALRQYVGSVSAEKMMHVCRALSIAVGCDGGRR